MVLVGSFIKIVSWSRFRTKKNYYKKYLSTIITLDINVGMLEKLRASFL